MNRSFEDEWESWEESGEMSEYTYTDNDKQLEEVLRQSALHHGSLRQDALPERETRSRTNSQEVVEEARPKTSPNHYSTRELVAALGSGEDTDNLPEPIQHRIRDYRLAQRKRRETYGNERPWGILSLYDHLASIRGDLEWAEDAAWRRQHGEPYLSWSDFDHERKKVSVRNRPFFTYFIMFTCTVMMIASIGVNGWKFEPITVNAMIGPSAETLLKMGAKQTSLIVSGEWFRLFSPIVLHAGLIHFFLNMLALWFIGGAIEKSHGMINGAILFVLPATGGNILSAIFLPQYISVGASGGIFGMIGACIADIILNWNMLFIKTDEETNMNYRYICVLAWLVFDILINILIGLTPFVDNFTHLGGMIYGLLCGFSTIERLSDGFFGLRKIVTWSFFVRFFGLILSVVGIMVSVAVLVGSDGGSSPCNGCRYISCVPFPPWADQKWWYCDDCEIVEANANKNGNFYYSLDLTCPDGEIENIDISNLKYTDILPIQKQLPSLCREHCDTVYNY
jgi:membrane associated rhomboid family serine protease